MMVGSLCVLLSLLWPFSIHVDDAGLTVRARGATTRLPWASIVRITVPRDSKGGFTAPTLMLLLAPGVRIKRRVGERKGDERLHRLLGLDDFTIPPEQVIATLKVYSPEGIVDADDYLSYRATKRLVSQLLREAEEDREDGH